jgi:hypothetical protein
LICSEWIAGTLWSRSWYWIVTKLANVMRKIR